MERSARKMRATDSVHIVAEQSRKVIFLQWQKDFPEPAE